MPASPNVTGRAVVFGQENDIQPGGPSRLVKLRRGIEVVGQCLDELGQGVPSDRARVADDPEVEALRRLDTAKLRGRVDRLRGHGAGRSRSMGLGSARHRRGSPDGRGRLPERLACWRTRRARRTAWAALALSRVTPDRPPRWRLSQEETVSLLTAQYQSSGGGIGPRIGKGGLPGPCSPRLT